MAMKGISLGALTLLSLLALLLSNFTASRAQSGPGAIQRTKDQLLVASLQPSTEATSTSPGSISSQLFLTSPSGSSAAYLVRPMNSASPSGHDYCYIQVQEGGSAVWKSTCASVSQASTCSLVFSGSGLEIFDGSRSSWRTNVNGGHRRNPETLVLLDGGGLQIRDQSGSVIWMSSESEAVDQNCESFGIPTENSAFSPFGSPSYKDEPESLSSSSSSSSSLGQSYDQNGEESEMGYNNNYQQQQETMNRPQQHMLNRPSLSGFNQPFSTVNQPFGASDQEGLGDNGTFENGASGSRRFMINVVLGSIITLLACLHFLL